MASFCNQEEYLKSSGLNLPFLGPTSFKFHFKSKAARGLYTMEMRALGVTETDIS